MVCTVNKIDSNVTGLSFAEEECLKELPDNPVWFALEPNTYSDFGADPTNTAREPITDIRQDAKGNLTDLDAAGGFNQDVTFSNTTRLLQGFFFANARQKGSSAPLNGTGVALTSSTGGVLTLASAIAAIKVGQVVVFNGSGYSDVDGQAFPVTAVNGAQVTLTGFPSHANFPAAATLDVAGESFAATAAVTLSGNKMILTVQSTPTVTPIPGEWVYFHGSSNEGYARLLSLVGDVYTFDRTSFSPVAATEAVNLFYGNIVLRSEDQRNLIVRRSYQLERQLGDDDAGVQSAILVGAVANQLTLNLKTGALATVDLTFVACDEQYRTGLDGLLPGTRVAAPGESGFNTASDISFVRMTIDSDTTPDPQGLFGYISDATLTIDNGVTGVKSIGVLGSFDTTAGNFKGGGSVTAYFTSVAANKAIRANADVGMHVAMAANNRGQLWDIPLLSLGGGRLTIEKDKPITAALTPAGAKSKYGHTMLFQSFAYLPDSAMPA